MFKGRGPSVPITALKRSLQAAQLPPARSIIPSKKNKQHTFPNIPFFHKFQVMSVIYCESSLHPKGMGKRWVRMTGTQMSPARWSEVYETYYKATQGFLGLGY